MTTEIIQFETPEFVSVEYASSVSRLKTEAILTMVNTESFPGCGDAWITSRPCARTNKLLVKLDDVLLFAGAYADSGIYEDFIDGKPHSTSGEISQRNHVLKFAPSNN